MKHFLKRNAEIFKNEDGYILYKMNRDDREYYIYFLSKRFSKYQNIILKEDGTVVIEYMYIFGGRSRPCKVRKVLCKPIIDSRHLNFVVYKGSPNMVFGLDDGVYKSSCLLSQAKFIYFLSVNDFYMFLNEKA